MVWIAANVALTALLAWIGSSFEPIESVLSRSTWEAGTPSSTYISAFATAGPWWLRHEPEAIRVTPERGVEHVVRVRRSDLVVTDEAVLPSRSVGYYAVVLLLAGTLAARDERFEPVAVPLVMAIGYLLFFGWFNRLLRLVTPAHFLLNAFVCYAVVYTAVALARFRARRATGDRRPGFETAPSTSP